MDPGAAPHRKERTMQSNATLSETRFYHSETITPAIYDFVVMGGLVLGRLLAQQRQLE